MKITSFKFGETSLYAVDGIVTRGIIRTRSSGNTKWAGGLFVFSLVFFLTTAAYTSGRSYLARFQYALGYYAVGGSLAAINDDVVVTETKQLPQLPVLAESEAAAVTAVPNPTKSGTAVVKPSSVPAAPAAQGKLGAYVAINRLHIEAPIIETALDMKTVNKDLQKGVIRWPDSAHPGESGSTILLGHSSAPLSYRGRYGSVFALLDKLIPGDVITLKYADETITYRVRDHVIIDPKKQRPDLAEGSAETLVLVSCWPVGTNWQRIAVRAERVY